MAWNDQKQSARYVVLDIETADADQQYIDKKLAAWQPPSNCKKVETIEKKREEAEEKIALKSALLDGAPIICVCTKTNNESVAFSSMTKTHSSVPGWSISGADNERDMLICLRDWLDQSTDETTTLIGHNLKMFDKPKLRNRFVRARVDLPRCLIPGSNFSVDTMQLGSHFSVERYGDRYISLDNLCEILDVDTPKQLITGADVPIMHRRGEYDEILMYCCIDVLSTEQCFLLMSGMRNEQNRVD